MSEVLPNNSKPELDPEQDILKVSELVHSGADINSAAIEIQQHYGVDVGPQWWQEHVTDRVGEGASQEQMAAAFDDAFPAFLNSQR